MLVVLIKMNLSAILRLEVVASGLKTNDGMTASGRSATVADRPKADSQMTNV